MSDKEDDDGRERHARREWLVQHRQPSRAERRARSKKGYNVSKRRNTEWRGKP